MWFWPELPKPSDFDAFVRDGRKKIANIVRSGRDPTSADFDPEWRAVSERYKPLFVTHQQTRCGYCDRALTDYGALDHLRPKASIAMLDPSNPGREVAGGVNRMGRFSRSTLREAKPGYWWLAFRWSNYVLACTQCNSGWKDTFVARTADTLERFEGACPSRCCDEGWLVLHPFASERTGEHFLFNEDGSVKGYSPAGRATIDVVALDRDSLRRARKDVVKDALRVARRFERLIESWTKDEHWALDEAQEALIDLLDKGKVDRPLASVVRAVTEAHLQTTWIELEALAKDLAQMPSV